MLGRAGQGNRDEVMVGPQPRHISAADLNPAEDTDRLVNLVWDLAGSEGSSWEKFFPL